MSGISGYDYLVKLLLVGSSGVGKSCLLLRFTDDSFTPTFITTIGIDFKIKTVDIDGRRMKLQIWDTAGQERFRTITTAYYRGAMGILLVYDVTNENSFIETEKWFKNIQENANPNVCVTLVGNKCDMTDTQVVSEERGREFAEKNGMKFLQTSAKNTTNVEEAFISLARDVKTNILDKITLQEQEAKKKRESVKIPVQRNDGSRMGGCC